MKRLIAAAALAALAGPSLGWAAGPDPVALGGKPGDKVELPYGAPEFGYRLEREVRGLGHDGEETVGQVTQSFAPDLKAMESYALDAGRPETVRLNAVKAVSELRATPAAIALLEKIATQAPRAGDAISRRVSRQAIYGLGESDLPEARKALEFIASAKTRTFQKNAAKVSLDKIAERDLRPLGYW